jgi:hypothetical protein
VPEPVRLAINRLGEARIGPRVDVVSAARGDHGGMNTSPATRRLAVVGRSAAGRPRTFRLEPAVPARPAASREAAYRRLAAVLLGLDVASLASELRQRRLALEPVAA